MQLENGYCYVKNSEIYHLNNGVGAGPPVGTVEPLNNTIEDGYYFAENGTLFQEDGYYGTVEPVGKIVETKDANL